jgi:hypothetical protein
VIVPCAICGGTATRRLYTKFGHDIGRCTSCGLVYANPRALEEIIRSRYSPDYFWKEYLPALGVVDGRYDWNGLTPDTLRCFSCWVRRPAEGSSRSAVARGSS